MSGSWDSVLTAAVLGTSRAKETVERLAPPFSAVNLRSTSQASLSDQVLNAAALLALGRRIGAQAVQLDLPSPPLAQIETLRPASAAATTQLRRVLDQGEDQRLLASWLRLAAGAGMQAEVTLLPTLLQLAETNTSLRAALLPVLGARGRWLAQLNSRWGFVLADGGVVEAEISDVRWHEGTLAERVGLLRTLRARDPARARDWLAATWGADSAEARAKLLAAIRIGLGAADEAFLESALDDRAQEVRALAAELLAELPAEPPGSAYHQRMIQRAAPFLDCKRGLLGRKLEVKLPDDYQDEWKRDGIRKELPPQLKGQKGIGEKAHWLMQLLAAVPTRYWREQWQVDADKMLKLAVDSDWRELLYAAWYKAALRTGDQDLLRALFPHALEAAASNSQTSQLANCLAAFPFAEAQALVAGALERNRGVWSQGNAALVQALAKEGSVAEWSAALAKAFSRSVIATFTGPNQQELWVLRTGIYDALNHLPIAAVRELIVALLSCRFNGPDEPSNRAREALRLDFVQYLERRLDIAIAFGAA